MKHFTIMAMVATTAAVLAACGGGDDDEPPVNCMSQQVYQQFIDSGAYQPRPWDALPPNYVWSDPYVIVLNPGGLPPVVGVFGPFYIPGTVPAYVCKDQ